jgi:hypothetical protein
MSEARADDASQATTSWKKLVLDARAEDASQATTSWKKLVLDARAEDASQATTSWKKPVLDAIAMASAGRNGKVATAAAAMLSRASLAP